MQRLLAHTTPADGAAAVVRGRPLWEEHARIVSILQSRLGQDHASLLARAEPLADGEYTWHTGAPGEIVGIADLPDAQRQALRQRAERLRSEIQGLADAMRAEGTSAAVVGELLVRVVQWPPGDRLYSVGGKPVAILWGHAGSSVLAAPGAPIPALPVSDADLVEAAAPAPAQGRPALRAAGALLAFLLLGVLYLAITRYLALQDGGRSSGAQIAALQAANAALLEQIARKRAATSQFVCVALPPPPPVQTAAPESAPEPAAAASEPPKPVKLADVKNMCPGERPRELAPELVIVFDASGSMAYSLNASEQEIRAASARDEQLPAFNLWRGFMGQAPIASSKAAVLQEPTRMTTARQAALSVVKRTPSDAGIGLVLVDQCPSARSLGYFPPARRAEVSAQLQGVRPLDGTPLANGVAQGGAMLNGVKRDAVMVVISDGLENCGGDPCAAAAALARSKPRLKINVVDITGTGAGNCLAKATGGKVFTARNAGEVAAMTARAAQDVMAPASCTKR